MTLTRVCCCGGCEYWYLDSCGPGPAIPRYVWKRCDIYELQTGDLSENCPATWVPNPYIVWDLERPGCPTEIAHACGTFRCATTDLITPSAITSDAIAAGYQTSPPLPEINVCEYCPDPIGDCEFILGGPTDILNWMTIDDCCTDDCGNLGNGVSLGCEFLSSNCGLPLSTVANAGIFGGGLITTDTVANPVVGGGLTWTPSVSAPTSWSVFSDPGGAVGLYELRALVDYSVNVSGTMACLSGIPGPCQDALTSPVSYTGNFQARIRAFVQASSANCGAGQLQSFSVAALGISSSATFTDTHCGSTQTFTLSQGVPSIASSCDVIPEIRFGRTNYMVLTLQNWSLSNSGNPLCPSIPGSGNSKIELEFMTPLGDPSVYGC